MSVLFYRPKSVLVLALVPALLAACIDTASDVGETAIRVHGGVVAGNSLTPNGLTSNGIVLNGALLNGLIANGLLANGLLANGELREALKDTLTRQFFSYCEVVPLVPEPPTSTVGGCGSS